MPRIDLLPTRTLLDVLRNPEDSSLARLLNFKRDGRWQSISAVELISRVREAAMGLYSLGVRAGDRVGLLSENRPEWTIADFATLATGASDVPVYSTQAPKQIEFILENAGVEVLFVSSKSQYERLREELARSRKLRFIITFDTWDLNDSRALGFEELTRRGRELDSREPQLYSTLQASVSPDTLATLIYTSGTTGEPKGVMLTHGNIVSNVLASSQILPIDSGSVALSFLPLSHIYERSTFYLYLNSSASIYYCDHIDAVRDYLLEVRPHYLTSVPRLFEKIYAKAMDKADKKGAMSSRIANWAVGVAQQWAEAKSRGRGISSILGLKHSIASRLVFSKWREATGGRIKCFISGGAPLSADLARVFYGAGLPILQGYGLTETSPVITANAPDHNRLGSVGRVLPGVSVRIAEDGEILCSGPNVMSGYYKNPEETKRALERGDDGQVWLHTGDIGHFDDDGFLYITDRKKDLIKTSGGKYIAPQPIENAIKQSRFVNQVVVIGDQRKFPAALIVPHKDMLESYAQMKGIEHKSVDDLLNDPKVLDLFRRQVEKYTQDLSQFEKIKAIALLGDELTIEAGELTPTLKVRRRIVADKYKHIIDRLYADSTRELARK